MNNLNYKFEPHILEAISDFEKEFDTLVTWGMGLDFYPDMSRATDDNVPLVATVGIYLEIPHTDETVVSGSIFVPPFMEDEQIHKVVFDSLVALHTDRAKIDSDTTSK
jgi:hypothetical protein